MSGYYIILEIAFKGKISLMLWHNHMMAGLLVTGTDKVKNNKCVNVDHGSSVPQPSPARPATKSYVLSVNYQTF